ncbi:MAG: hypothetical protein JRF27_04120, partial [Deltaproteobacteria bacterium]|nr:hypothetical protein [Deltaproteobacteria bacterium]
TTADRIDSHVIRFYDAMKKGNRIATIKQTYPKIRKIRRMVQKHRQGPKRQ